jgi:WD40 repeat protein/transcriptional regulator with XRE-family HTH domain
VAGVITVVEDPSAEGFRSLMLGLRGRTGLTQPQLANRIGVSIRSIQAWEAGASYPSAGSLQLLLAAFVDAHGFVPGLESSEAEAVWDAALSEAPRQLPPFDRVWFDSLFFANGPSSIETMPVIEPQRTPGYSSGRWQDWGDAPDVAGFVGRPHELDMLSRWVLDDKCRVVAVLGAGGVGKTRLAARLAHDVEAAFERDFWRSVRNAPTAMNWLGDAISALSGQELIPPEGEGARVSVLLELLRAHRCLVVIDNLESLLEPGRRDGQYRTDVGDYRELFRAVGQTDHNSCMVLTSRESPAELYELQDNVGAVRALELRGVDPPVTQVLLRDQKLRGDATAWAGLTSLYSGNPLALRVVGQTIRQVFNGDIVEFLTESESSAGHVYGGIRNLLESQWGRLSSLEQDLMRWLAVERDPVTFAELAADMRHVGRAVLIEVIDALRRRSLVERIDPGPRFTLQSVVLEYVTEATVETVVEEVDQAAPRLLSSHPLIKARAKDYLRRIQERLLIVPILEQLTESYGSQRGAELRLLEIIDKQRQSPARDYGFAHGNVVNLLRVLRGDLRGVDLSRLRIRHAFIQDTNMQDANLAGTDVSESALADVFSWPLCLSLSGDARYLAAGTSMGEVYLWRVLDRALVARWKAHNGMTLSVALSDQAERLVSCSDDGTARLWEPFSGQLLFTCPGHAGGALSAAVSGNGRLFASGDATGRLRAWNADDGELLADVSAHPEGIWGMSFDDVGSRLASVSDTSVRVWDAESHQLQPLLEGHHGANFSVAFSGDGRVVAAGSFDGSVRVWQVDTGRLIATLPGHTGGVWSVALSSDGDRLISGGIDGTVRAWDTVGGLVTATMRGHTGGARSVSLSRDGQTLASGSTDGTVRLWQANGELLSELRGFTSGIRAIALSANGQLCASASFDRTVRLWDVDHDSLAKTWVGHSAGLWAVAMSADGKLIASGGDDCALNLWRVEQDQPAAVLHGHSTTIWSIAVSPDGEEVISGSLDGTVRIWSVEPTGQVAVLDAGTGPVWGVVRSRDGRLLASAGAAGMITLWDLQGRSALTTFQGHASPIFGVALNGEGSILVSAGFDATARLWDTSSGDYIGTLEGHTAGVWGIAFSLDGRFVASGGFDGVVRVWDAASLRLLHSLRGHTGGIWSVAFDERAQVLASAGVDGAIFIWDVDKGAARTVLRRDRIYERMNITGLTGVTEAQRGALLALGALEHAAQPLETGQSGRRRA